VEQKKCLGIYLSSDKAIGVILEGHSGHYKVLGCSTAKTNPDEPETSLAARLVEDINLQNLKYDEVSVAVDCQMYTQHDLHSQFSDHKQIANTIRFDAEEAVATDATELAVAFDITHTDKTGADVTVYTAKRFQMSDMLNSMFESALDPTAMEPDIACLSRFIEKNNKSLAEPGKLVVIISDKACYLITPSDSNHAPCVRSFLVSPTQNIAAVLSREIPITIASMHTPEPITSIVLAGNTEDINSEDFSLKTGLDVVKLDLAEETGTDISTCSEDVPLSDFATAYGAALAELSRTSKTDFRKDFMPYEGRIRTIQAALRVFSIAVTVVLIAVGAYFQKNIMDLNKQTNELEFSLYEEQAAIVFGRPHKDTRKKLSTRLKGELRKVQSGATGSMFSDDSSVTAKLTYLFEAINKSRKNNKIMITKISIQRRSMRVEGTTANRGYTNDFLGQIDKHPKLIKTQVRLGSKPTGDTFSVSIELK